MNRSVSLDLLQAFETVIQEGGFSSAATALGGTQQGVSLKIKSLETLVGRPLFERRTRHLILTQDGEALRIYAHKLLGLAEQLKTRFSSKPLTGAVRIGLTSGFAWAILPPVLAELRSLNPRFEVKTETGRTHMLMSRLDAGKLDVVVGSKAEAEGQVSSNFLTRDKLLWVGDAEKLVVKGKPIPLAIFPPPTYYRDLIFKKLQEHDLHWEVVLESDDIMAIRAAVSASWGMSVFCKLVIDNDEVFRPVHQHTLLPEMPNIDFFIATRPGHILADSVSEVIRMVSSSLQA